MPLQIGQFSCSARTRLPASWLITQPSSSGTGCNKQADLQPLWAAVPDSCRQLRFDQLIASGLASSTVVWPRKNKAICTPVLVGEQPVRFKGKQLLLAELG